MVVDKTAQLKSVDNIRGTLRDECSVSNPVITIEYATFPTFNYCYIPTFSRYYYIDNIIVLRNGVYELYLRCDVLMSFKDVIKNNVQGIVVRNDLIQESLIVDSSIIFENDTKYKKIVFDSIPDLFADSLNENSYCYVLQTYDAYGEAN